MAITQKIVSIFLTFFGRMVFLRVLSVEYLGISNVFASVLGLLTMADLGLSTAITYSYYKPIAEKDEQKLAALSFFYKRTFNIIGAAIAVIGLALTPFIGMIINVENPIPHIEIYFLLYLVNVVISYLVVHKVLIITADQNKHIVTKYNMWMSVFNTILRIAVLLITGSFMIYCLVVIITKSIYNILISRKANKLYPFIKNGQNRAKRDFAFCEEHIPTKKVKLAAADKRAVFQNMKSAMILKFANVFLSGTDNFFISVLIGTAMVGKYVNYFLAVSSLNQFGYIVFRSLSASIGNVVATESPEKRLQIFKTMQTASCWIGGFFCFCLFFLLDDFVALWLGREFVFDPFTKIIILLNLYLSIAMHPIAAFREATGMFQKTKLAMVAAAVLKVVLAIVLGMLFGLPGILAANFLAGVLTYAWYEPKILFRDFLHVGAVGYLIGHVLNLILLMSLIAGIYFLLPWFIDTPENLSWLEWLIKGVVCTILINAVYLLRYFKTPEFRIIKDKTIGFIKRG